MILNPDIERYLHSLLPARDSVLSEMEAFAAEHAIPIVGPAVGGLLAVLVAGSGARRIFELGSAIGYSTIWLARAAGPHAEVHYSDGSQDNARRARAYFERAGVAGQIHIHVGDALEALRNTEGEFDFIFNDVDKHGYLDVLEAVPPRLKPGGLFVTDNALWHGHVLAPADRAAQTIVEFNRKLFENKDLFSTIIPIRDGILVACKR